MKTIFVLASLALSALAQRAYIISPADGATIAAGSEIVVDVHQDNSATDQTQIAIVLGLNSCPNGDCDGVVPGQNGIGTMLSRSLFSPQYDPSLPRIGMHQNFTVQIPPRGNLNPGPNILSLTHLQMIGVAKSADLETSGIVVNIV